MFRTMRGKKDMSGQNNTGKVIGRADLKQLVCRLDRFEAALIAFMARYGVSALRVSLGVVFLWFGALKLFPGLSPAEGLVGRTLLALTHGILEPSISVPVLGIWESLIGLGLISGRYMRATLVLLFAQMSGTVTPLFLFPGEVFVDGPLVLTMEGQYIIKNVVLISAAVVIGATVRGGRLKSEPTGTHRANRLQHHTNPRITGTKISSVIAQRAVL